jgi:HSP20 family protein
MTRALAPWTGLATFRSEMDRLLDRVFAARWDEFPALGDWTPKLDVTETKDAVVVEAEVPGVEPKDIHVSLQEQLLTITGDKHQEREAKGERWHRVERSYGSFTRSLRLPVPVDAERVTAAFKHGLLTVTLPKTPAAKGTAIPVKEE